MVVLVLVCLCFTALVTHGEDPFSPHARIRFDNRVTCDVTETSGLAGPVTRSLTSGQSQPSHICRHNVINVTPNHSFHQTATLALRTMLPLSIKYNQIEKATTQCTQIHRKEKGERNEYLSQYEWYWPY